MSILRKHWRLWTGVFILAFFLLPPAFYHSGLAYKLDPFFFPEPDKDDLSLDGVSVLSRLSNEEYQLTQYTKDGEQNALIGLKYSKYDFNRADVPLGPPRLIRRNGIITYFWVDEPNNQFELRELDPDTKIDKLLLSYPLRYHNKNYSNICSESGSVCVYDINSVMGYTLNSPLTEEEDGTIVFYDLVPAMATSTQGQVVKASHLYNNNTRLILREHRLNGGNHSTKILFDWMYYYDLEFSNGYSSVDAGGLFEARNVIYRLKLEKNNSIASDIISNSDKSVVYASKYYKFFTQGIQSQVSNIYPTYCILVSVEGGLGPAFGAECDGVQRYSYSILKEGHVKKLISFGSLQLGKIMERRLNKEEDKKQSYTAKSSNVYYSPENRRVLSYHGIMSQEEDLVHFHLGTVGNYLLDTNTLETAFIDVPGEVVAVRRFNQ